MANTITGCRVIGSILLLCFPVFSPWFYTMYLINGFTDMIDGTVARKTNSVSEFGARLDTIADFLFVVCCLIKLLPEIVVPAWIMIWIVVIALIKVTNVITAFIYLKKFAVEHTIMNKVTGLLLFLTTLTLTLINITYSSVVVCTVATFAAIQEGYLIRTKREVM